MGPVYRRTMISEPEILDVREPPGKAMGKVAELWKPVEGTNKIMCTACARYCKIGEGQVGLCGIRGVHEGKLWLYVYGRVITGHVDPIEKKPVSHYRPGSKIFSIATTGCNWLCHPAGTSILMADGSQRPVEFIKAGDRLWSYNIDGGYQIVPSVVSDIGTRLDWIYRTRIGSRGSSSLYATADQPVLTNRGWVLVGNPRPGDQVLKVWYQNTQAWKRSRAPTIARADFVCGVCGEVASGLSAWNRHRGECYTRGAVFRAEERLLRSTRMRNHNAMRNPLVAKRALATSKARYRGDLTLEENGWRVLRIWSKDLFSHEDAVFDLLEEACASVLRTNKKMWLPVQSVTRTDRFETVHSFECVSNHNYVADGLVVHNCRYCQNADISQRRKVEGIEVEPQDVVRMTLEQGCQGLAYTYNQPTIFIEFARDIGMRARKAGLINIFVSNGYDTPETVAEMPKFLDCVTVDYKGSGETNFVRKYINIPNAEPIFQTLLDTRDTKKIHIEITDLIVPQVGDDLGAARKLSKWVYDNLGPDTPIHFLRFHPDYKMMEFPWTPVETLEKHCAVAKEEGLKYVYIGNVSGHPLEHTYCPGCGAVAIKRYGFDITGWYLDKDNKCKKCGYQLAIFGRLERTAKENRYYSVLYHR